MHKITGDGLKELEGYELEEGKTYYLGASDSPDLIYIESLEEDRVIFRYHPFHDNSMKTERREVAEDLIKEGCETMEDQGRGEYVARDTDLEEIQRMELKFRVTPKGHEEMDKPVKEIEQRYRQDLGLETNHGAKEDHTYRTRVTKENVPEIMDLETVELLELHRAD